MKLFLNIFITFFLAANFTSHALADNPTPLPFDGNENIFNTVILQFDNNNDLYDVTRNYGPTLRYQIPDDLTITYSYDRQSYRIRLAPIVDRAARYWDQLLGPYGFHIYRADTGTPSNFIISTMSIDQAATLGRGLVPQAFTPPPNSQGLTHARERLPYLITGPGMYITESRSIDASQHEFIRRIFGPGDLDRHFESLIYLFILHEFGHAVGLTHPETVTERINDLYETLEMGFLEPDDYADPASPLRQVGVIRGRYDSDAQIMFQSEEGYLEALHLQHGGRNITTDDFVLSRNEREIITNYIGGCSSARLRR
ncbi:hypothetical protein [Xenorhabdus sp. SGI240]|uniref:hypothetical protein n=1 Tax=Xenorhabdus sp. SGI240 TaxID=3158262 RepID=UPI0032B848DB